jgi:cytosine/adenosine deaminase-related metal-dependent hydrolase
MPPAPPFVDAGNRLLAPVTADLETGTADLDGIKYAVVTVRTASTTMTVMLDARTYAAWMRTLTGLQSQVGSGIQVVTPGQARLMGLDGHRPERPDPG